MATSLMDMNKRTQIKMICNIKVMNPKFEILESKNKITLNYKCVNAIQSKK